MWRKSYSIITKKVTKEQIWKLFADVNNWHTWDKGIEYATLHGEFKAGNYFLLKPKGAPEVMVELLDVVENKKFKDITRFPGAKMYDEHEFEETSDGLKIINTISVDGPLAQQWIKAIAQNIVDSLPTDVIKQIEAASKL